jgi:uncharacterized protein
MQAVIRAPLPTPAAELAGAPSPCINICVMDDASGWCTGCFRTIDEIVGWGTSSQPARWAVLGALAAREARYFGVKP